MRHICIHILLLLLCSICCAQTTPDSRSSDVADCMVGADISGLIYRKCLRITIGHRLSERWSAGASVPLGIRNKEMKIEDEETEHENEFSASISNTLADLDSRIFLQYWLNETYKGWYLQFGCRGISHGDADITIAAGCNMPLWKGLSVSLAAEKDLIASKKNNCFKGNGFSINLFYAF